MGIKEGRGEYKWRNGTEYRGDWCKNYMDGIGVLIWAGCDKK